MIKSSRSPERTVLDRAREPWVVEDVGTRYQGQVPVRFRHELGYELVALAPASSQRLSNRALRRLLEEAKLRAPRGAVPAA
ncbi:MAG: hypothetical protein P8177_01070 [Gemmatimonadota bacterium]|jgi:hypothetical protein